MRSSPLDRLCFLANDSLLSLTLLVILLNTSPTCKSWLMWSLLSLVGVWWFWWEAWYLPLLYMDSSSTLEFLVADITVDWAWQTDTAVLDGLGLGLQCWLVLLLGWGLLGVDLSLADIAS